MDGPVAIRARRILTLTLPLLVACSRPNPATQPANWDNPDTEWLSESKAPAARILGGFDKPTPTTKTSEPNDSWLVGTEVLYSMYVEGRGDPQTRLIHFRLKSQPLQGIRTVRINPKSLAQTNDVFDISDPGEKSYELPVTNWEHKTAPDRSITSDSVVVWMALYDEAGRKLASRYHLLPELHLRTGLVTHCTLGAQAPSSGPESCRLNAPSAGDECSAALYSFGKVAAASPITEPTIKRIMSRSTLLGIWLFGKPQFGFNLGEPSREARELPTAEYNGHAWLLPIDISMDGKPTLRSRATVTTPTGPFRLCAGVLAFDGFRIDDPSRRFRMVLIAAHHPPDSPQ